MTNDQIVIAFLFVIACFLSATTGYFGKGYFHKKQHLARSIEHNGFMGNHVRQMNGVIFDAGHLVAQLPTDHEGRNAWLREHGPVVSVDPKSPLPSGLESSSEHPAKHEQEP